MTSTTLPYASTTSTTPRASGHLYARPGFWRAPFAGATYREIGHTLTSLPVAIAGFVFAVTMFALGVSTLVVWIGLPVLAAALGGARGLGAAERGRARSCSVWTWRRPRLPVPGCADGSPTPRAGRRCSSTR